MSNRLFWRQLKSFKKFQNNSNSFRTYSQQSNNVVGRSNGIRPSVAIASTLALSLAGYTIGSLYPLELFTLIHARPAPPPPPSSSPEALALTAHLEQQLQQLPLLKSHRSLPDADEWYEVRPYQRFPAEKKVHSLTAGALAGAGRLALSPLVRAKKDESESIAILHVGRSLCGHDGIVHGGLIATILDESMGRVALLNFPTNVGVTANLSVNYRAPTRADQFLIVRVKLTEMRGRKSWTSATIETMDGTLLADATGLFIEPKYAKLLSSSGVRAALGAPEELPITADVKGASGNI